MADPNSLSVQAAREEALSMLAVAKQSGYQKLAKGSAPVIQKLANTIGKSILTSGTTFHIRSVGMLTCRLDWQLLQHYAKAFKIIKILKLNGMHLFENKGCSKAAIDTSHLWFTMRWQVPNHVYETWNTKPIILESDTDDSIKDDAVSLLSNLVSALVVSPRMLKKDECSPYHTMDIKLESESSLWQHAMKKMKNATAPEIASLSLMPGLVVEVVLSSSSEVIIVDKDDVLF
ncbi:hypothetical protein HD554DRAFT_2038365 [Boletus coccyginus]|nr:hypothetical protein HD554DRAFT_2038365 [Boletus coccyginus]